MWWQERWSGTSVGAAAVVANAGIERGVGPYGSMMEFDVTSGAGMSKAGGVGCQRRGEWERVIGGG